MNGVGVTEMELLLFTGICEVYRKIGRGKQWGRKEAFELESKEKNTNFSSVPDNTKSKIK